MTLTKEPMNHLSERRIWKSEEEMVIVIWYEYVLFINLNESIAQNEPSSHEAG